MLEFISKLVSLKLGFVRKGHNRVLRGGSYFNDARNLRSAYRNHNSADNRNHNIGLRLAAALSRLLLVAGVINQHKLQFQCFIAISVEQNQGLQHASRPTDESLLLSRLLRHTQ